MGHYYHLFANGDDARDFITSENDFKAAFNRFSVCAFKFPQCRILAFSIEESHPHVLVYGTYEDVIGFKQMYESMTYSYIIASRGSKDGVEFELEPQAVTDEDYLLNVSAYVLVQPTKDGKKVMPYDYRWGTGSMYFRPEGLPPLWCFDSQWRRQEAVELGSLPCRIRRSLVHSRIELPSHWQVCNGLVLPSNYLDVNMFESIFKTYNRFRVFMCAGKKQLQRVSDNMAAVRGITMNDSEARQLAYSESYKLYGKKDSRWLSPLQRLELAKVMRSAHRLSIRQISTLCRLPETEIRKYIQ